MEGKIYSPIGKFAGSLDFAVTRFLMKLFKSSNINVINDCRWFFNFMLPSEIIEKRKSTFEIKVSKCNSMLYYFNMSL